MARTPSFTSGSRIPAPAVRLLLKLGLFAVLFGGIAPWALLAKLGWIRQWESIAFPGAEIHRALAASEVTVPSARVVVLGDSTAFQHYGIGARGHVYSLACNQAVSLAGHYELLSRFAAVNDMRGRTVALVMHPESFANDLDQALSFHYFLKPFYAWHERGRYSDLVRSRIAGIPFSWAASLPIVKMSSWSPDWSPPARPGGLSLVSAEYLRRIAALAGERGFSVKVLPPLLSASRSAQATVVSTQAREAGLGALFAEYRPVVLPDALFGDGVHVLDRHRLGPNPLGL